MIPHVFLNIGDKGFTAVWVFRQLVIVFQKESIAEKW